VIPIVTPEEMAAVDAAAPEPVGLLIERAGAAVAAAALDLLGGAYGRRVVVLAGKGNNGADGRSAARRLAARGVRVTVVDTVDAPPWLPPADLVIDAAYGTGFHGEHVPPSTTAPVLAVDIPSGVAGLTGAVPGGALRAVRTVTFAALKPGLLLGAGRPLAGEVVVVDLGLDVSAARAGLVERDDVVAWLPGRTADAHKWVAAVLVVAGSVGMTGAAHLAAAAAQRAGAGMVRLGTPGLEDDPGRPREAVGVRLPSRGWAEDALAAAARAHALVLGPGLGATDATRAGVQGVLAGSSRPAVVDGDALTALGSAVGDVLRARGGPTVLTPHDGEFARLVGAPPGDDRLDAVRELAAATGAIVLLKGPVTVVGDPAGEVRVVAVGDARLATAGTGDVLSGVVGALLAQGVPALEAAAAGAWLQGRAGAHGPAHGLVASDLLSLLPSALAEVTARSPHGDAGRAGWKGRR
jgi:ADP-dependent NAD(P)H-hydrate dehydratase / NAD(P)H-hydrate epimerase